MCTKRGQKRTHYCEFRRKAKKGPKVDQNTLFLAQYWSHFGQKRLTNCDLCGIINTRSKGDKDIKNVTK